MNALVAKKRRTYWLAANGEASAEGHRPLLQERGYDLEFFTSFDAFAAATRLRRPSIVVITDGAGAQRLLLKITAMPEVNGARLILATRNENPELHQLAAAANFRDIIPLTLTTKEFVARFDYATAGKSARQAQPSGLIAMRNISAASLPARVIWLSDDKIRLECRARPKVGAALSVGGALARALGVKALALKVLESHNSHLIYRFSDAIVAAWSVPEGDRAKAEAALKILRTHNTGPRTRVFIAMQHPDLRASLIAHFDHPAFEVTTALQKQSIVDDPRYFTPDIIFIEDALALDGERFVSMLEGLSHDCTVFVIGQMDGLSELQKRFVQHKLIELRKPGTGPISFEQIKQYLPNLRQTGAKAVASEAVHFSADSEFSLAEVQIPARLARIHPAACQIGLPFAVSNFSLIRVDSPLLRKLLGRSPWVKLHATYADHNPDSAPFAFLADGYLADVDPSERGKLATELSRLLSEHYQPYTGPATANAKLDKASPARTPEFGSVKTSASTNLAPARQHVAASMKIAAKPGIGHDIAAEKSASARDARALDGAAALALVEEEEEEEGQALATNTLRSAAKEVRAHGDLSPDDLLIQAITAAQSQAAQRPSPKALVSDVVVPEATLAAKAEPDRTAILKAKRREKTLKELRTVLTFLAITGGALALFWVAAYLIAPNWDKSGGVYSEQLKIFAPKP